MTSTNTPDVIDQLTGIPPGHSIDAIRSRRAQARLHGQNSYLALFEPARGIDGGFTAVERFAVAAFVSAAHREPRATAFYVEGFARNGGDTALIDAVLTEAAAGQSSGPYGRFPAGPLRGEDAPGATYRTSDARAGVLGARLSAALAHAHLLVFHPRDAGARDLQALLEAGWSASDVVTLSQLVAFLAYQLRVVTGLQVLRDAPAASTHTPEASTRETAQA